MTKMNFFNGTDLVFVIDGVCHEWNGTDENALVATCGDLGVDIGMIDPNNISQVTEKGKIVMDNGEVYILFSFFSGIDARYTAKKLLIHEEVNLAREVLGEVTLTLENRKDTIPLWGRHYKAI